MSVLIRLASGKPFEHHGKVFRFDMDALDMADSRFGMSPLAETYRLVVALVKLTDPRALPQPAWVHRAGRRFERARRQHPEVELLAMSSTGWGVVLPYFLYPTPSLADRSALPELAEVRAFPKAQAQEQLAQVVAERPWLAPETAAALLAPDAPQRLTKALEIAWYELMAPEWPTISSALRRDVSLRARSLITGGWQRLLPELFLTQNRWEISTSPDGVRLSSVHRSVDEHYPAGGGGLIFIPSAVPASTSFIVSEKRHGMLYTAAGLLAEPDTARPTDGALARLIGRTRAQLLVELERPATTTQLSRRFDLSLGVVGHHLAALRAAALVTRTRFGQSVVYELTPLGSALLEANPERPDETTPAGGR